MYSSFSSSQLHCSCLRESFENSLSFLKMIQVSLTGELALLVIQREKYEFKFSYFLVTHKYLGNCWYMDFFTPLRINK